jgi:CubicO group peptidase (beta-lactamase class C family)
MNPLDTLIHSYMQQQAALGAAVAILQDGEIIYLNGFGTTSVEEGGVQVTPRTLFAYGSISKNLCAVLIMRMVEQGLLQLDMPIVHYLPSLQFSDAERGRKITLRHLLSHTSGLPMGGKVWGPRDPDSLRRFVYEQIPYYTFLSEPGAVHLYSNTVICVAGHVAEAVTGQFYDDLVQEYVFDPLQMSRVTYDPVIAMTYPVALPHERGENGQLRVVHKMTYNVSGNPSSFALGSVSDLANLAQMYLSQGQFGGQHFLTAASIAEMQRIHGSRHIEAALHPLADNYLGYGLGFEIGDYRGRRAAGHGGMNLTYNCFFKLFPDERVGVVVLTNQCNDPLLWEMVKALYDYALGLSPVTAAALERLDARVTALTHHQIQRYIGTFVQVETADLATFAVINGQLTLQRKDNVLPLIAVGNGAFYADVTAPYRLPVAFIDDAKGQVAHVLIRGEPYHPITLDQTFQPDLQLWQSFVGRYKDPSNNNHDEIFTVRLQDGVLFITEGTHEVPCRAINQRSFLSTLGLFTFEDTDMDAVKLLVWGKAVRFYPVDQQAYLSNKVIQYLVDIPVIQPRAS